MSGLRESTVSKCLDKKLTMLGYEVPDLMVIFVTLSTLNFIFGDGLKLPCVWLPTIAIALTLRFGKRGKPDNYLVHWLRFQIRPGVYSAFTEPSIQTPPPRLKAVSQ